MVELVGQGPALQWPGLVQRIRLLLDQRQIMEWIADKRAPLCIGVE